MRVLRDIHHVLPRITVNRPALSSSCAVSPSAFLVRHGAWHCGSLRNAGGRRRTAGALAGLVRVRERHCLCLSPLCSFSQLVLLRLLICSSPFLSDVSSGSRPIHVHYGRSHSFSNSLKIRLFKNRFLYEPDLYK